MPRSSLSSGTKFGFGINLTSKRRSTFWGTPNLYPKDINVNDRALDFLVLLYNVVIRCLS